MKEEVFYYIHSLLEMGDMAHQVWKHLTEMSRQTDTGTEGGSFYCSFRFPGKVWAKQGKQAEQIMIG